MEKAFKGSAVGLIIGLLLLGGVLIFFLSGPHVLDSSFEKRLEPQASEASPSPLPSHMSTLFAASTVITHHRFERASSSTTVQSSLWFMEQTQQGLRKLSHSSLDGGDSFGI